MCSLKELLDEHNHLGFLNEAVVVLVNGTEGSVELRFVKGVGRRDIGEDLTEEFHGLRLVQLSAVVGIVLYPDLVNAILIDTILFNLRGKFS